MTVTLIHADMRDALAEMEPGSIDSVVTDPPYHLIAVANAFGPGQFEKQKGKKAPSSRGFMGCEWDGGDIAFKPETWALVLRVLKPGGHLLAFNHSRTFHRMWCAVEDAGFEVRDTLFWAYGSGFPKSHDVSKGIDKHLGATGSCSEGASGKGADTINAYGTGLNVNFAARPSYTPATPEAAQWNGWGTALKPALEPIVLARKPLSESSIARQVMATGTGALNIDGCRVGTSKRAPASPRQSTDAIYGTYGAQNENMSGFNTEVGRWPANLLHDGSHEVRALFPMDGAGSAARFYYVPKADRKDRRGSKHPTVKPHDLMRWLVRLVTPPGGTVLDRFAGSGATGWAARAECMSAILIEREDEYAEDIRRVLDGRHSAPESVEPEEPRQLSLIGAAE